MKMASLNMPLHKQKQAKHQASVGDPAEDENTGAQPDRHCANALANPPDASRKQIS